MQPWVTSIVRGARASFVCGALAIATVSGAAAQEVSPEDRAKLRAMFEEILKDPSNLDLTYAYAQAATQAGDYEAAVTAYERLLLFNPDLPRVKAELGVLYYRLGSYDIARQYLEQALAEGDPPQATRERIEGFLARIEESVNPHRFAGSLAFGARYQSNANFGPEDDILVLDNLVDANADTEATEDFNLFASLTGRYVYDLGNDAGDYLFARGALYAARQFDVTELDVEHLRITAGPGFRLYPVDSGPVVLEPHARVTYVRLDDESFNFSYGAGFDASWQILDRTSLFLNSFGEARQYSATDERQNADTQDGAAFRVAVGAAHSVDQDLFLRGEVFGGKVDTADASEEYAEYGASATVGYRIESPLKDSASIEFAKRPWNLTLTGRYANRDYTAANNIVSVEPREDDEFRIDGTVAAPVGEAWSVFATLGFQDNSSNLPNNDFQNFSVALGASMRF